MKRFWIVLAGALAALSAAADVKLPALFSNGMVLQRETIAPMWGWAEPGEKITVSTTWGAKAAATAEKDGTWQVALKTPVAGGPFDITVQGNNTETLTNVLSGEVWLCTGQSNMDCELKFFTKDAKEEKYQPLVDYIRNEIKTANDPLLRHIAVPRNPSFYEKVSDFKGRWVSVNPEESSGITATGYFFGRELRRELGVPVGLVECTWGGTRIQAWISPDVYRADPEKAAYYESEAAALKKRSSTWNAETAEQVYQEALAKWEASDKKDKRPKKPIDPVKTPYLPVTLHNGMVSAVVPYAIKGAIWYQGESNSRYMTDSYEDYFTTLIQSWREEWGRGDFPFYWAQLANWDGRDAWMDRLGWVKVCDQQRRTLKLPNTGMAVLNDIGEAQDVHPHNKMDAGKRLALWALANDYGIKVPAYSGPLYKSHTIKKGTVLVTFDHAGSGLMTGHKNLLDDAEEVNEPLQFFEITGADHDWKRAEARIVSADTIDVSHPDIPDPVAVRYAWSIYPEGANLYNKEGLPASVFTTE
ncbi:sialate O-acetylesterase [Pontiella sulfatireligans]|uniref:Sialate O-acetylesterase domain-containing protein n=1 Tax=Pontiella sulfatireligans TaxID=2750658 RepID=A0A6C2UF24_9BACT|nr:sialate O-acetylesterase [Pontiella sulfatireligans]VGO18519.1 hypothetical protein SCARR_00572 [Pontiella sulfatireligans]